MPPPPRPKLRRVGLRPTEATKYLVGGEGHLPSVEDLIALLRAVTGREPTPDDIEAAKKLYRSVAD